MIRCRFCGAEEMEWINIKGRWRLFDNQINDVHECPDYKHTGWRHTQVYQDLLADGFKEYMPSDNRWCHVLIRHNDTQTLYFLFAHTSVAVLIYDQIQETIRDASGRLVITINGVAPNQIVIEDQVDLPRMIKEVARRFLMNLPLDATYIQRNAWLWSTDSDISKKRDRLEDFSDLLIDNGQDAYLGDGIWITADGEVVEK